MDSDGGIVEKRRRAMWVRGCGEVLLLVLLLVGVPVGLKVRYHYQVRPRGGTLAEHLAAMPEPREFRVCEVNGAEYLGLCGPSRPWGIASGQPVYVFGAGGNLIDFTPDDGDDGDFNRRWSGLYGGRSVTRAEAVAWASAARRPAP